MSGSTRSAAPDRREEALLAAVEIHLRELGPDDVTERYLAWLNDPEVKRYLETRHRRQDLEAIRAFVAHVNASEDEHLFGICLTADGRHIGNIKLGPIKANHSLADVSLFTGERDCWGQGYASEAIRLVSAFAIEELGLSKLAAGFYAPNEASISAFAKAGFSREGLRRKHYLLDGEPCDIVEMGLTAEDYWLRKGASCGNEAEGKGPE